MRKKLGIKNYVRMDFISFFYALDQNLPKSEFYDAEKTAKALLYGIFFLPKALLNNYSQ